MSRRATTKNRIGNEGSTLITVIVAIAFVTILTSIILGTSVMNIRMKAIDRRSKDDFYYAEKALNDVYSGIGQITAKAAGDMYDTTFKNVGTTVDGVDYSFSENAEKEFKKKFIKETKTKVKLSSLSDLKSLMQSYIVPVSGVTSTVEKVGGVVYEKYNGTVATEATADRVRIKGVEVKSKDDNGFTAIISTDIIIETPTLDFLSSSVDVSDYSLIANKGIYIYKDGNVVINGNEYAGLHSESEALPAAISSIDFGEEKLYGGINIHDAKVTMNGNYIVSKGDINISGGDATNHHYPKLTVGSPAGAGVSNANLPNVYFDTIRTVSGSELNKAENVLELNSNTYALNDLELNADNSRVKITGNYYGYNDKTLPDPSKKESGQTSFAFSSGHDDADSSAIIINGSHATLDMKDIRALVLMGRAYIDFSKGAKGGQSTDAEASKKTNVAATAEAIALKTNQQLYLLPADLLESPNPVLESGYGSGFKLAKVTDPVNHVTTEKINDWFGYCFIDTADPFKTYKVTMSDDSSVYYAYLNFNNKKWLKDTTNDPAAKFGYVEDTSGAVLGTGGSISSMELFFDIIMNQSRDYHNKFKNDAITAGKTGDDINEYVESKEKEKWGNAPTPYTIYGRIAKSMGWDYFDLQDCIIGNGASSAIIYSQNAIVSYETEKDPESGNVKRDSENNPIFSNYKRSNTVGMERYAGYPQNLFHRYQWITTFLNAHQDVVLEKDPNDSSSPIHTAAEISTVKSEWTGDGKGYYSSTTDAPPLSHFAELKKITSTLDTSTAAVIKKAQNAGLSRNAYGDIAVKKGNLTIGNGKDIITVGDTFKGVAIVDGDITVASGTTVNGLLMATGRIIIEAGTPAKPTTISYDKGLIQSRIEKEMAIVKGDTDPDTTETDDYKSYYLITYLSDNRPTGASGDNRLYKVISGSRKKEDRIEADYHTFMFYENWKKGPND